MPGYPTHISVAYCMCLVLRIGRTGPTDHPLYENMAQAEEAIDVAGALAFPISEGPFAGK